MKRILGKRIPREFKSNLFRYLALGLLVALGMYIVISLVDAAQTVITGVDSMAEQNHLEDGAFSVLAPMTSDQERQLTDLGVTIETMFYLDYFADEESTLRLFVNRENINLVSLDQGQLAQKTDEIVLEKRYAKEHALEPGDMVEISGEAFKIVGIGSVPDYDAVFRNITDSSIDSKQFGLGFVCQSAYDRLKLQGAPQNTESCQYSYLLNGKLTDKELKAFLNSEDKSGKLLQFTKAENNPRIGASANDQVINKMAGLVAGVIVMILFTYVISVFVIHGIEKESSVIGALYALGARKSDLIFHYLTLPVVMTMIGGIIGTILGFSRFGVNVQIQDCYNYFSLPELPTVYPPYLILYGTVMPPVAAAVVNCLVIYRRLSQPTLKLIRNESKQSRTKNINLGRMGFIRRFCIRQMLREARIGLTVVFGMFICMLILMMGVNCYVLCQHISEGSREDTKFEYMYLLKYPDTQIPEGGTPCYSKQLSKTALGYEIDVTLMGIDQNNPYFDITLDKNHNKVVIASSTAQKYGLRPGDALVLTDDENDQEYTFDVTGVADYSVGLYVFMDMDTMRGLFNQNTDDYNVLLADKKLDVAKEQLFAVTTKDDIVKASDVFMDQMMPLVTMLTGVSSLVFCVVMYLMLKVMIDRSSYGISLLKVFGYRNGEIRKLYLNGNFFIIFVGAVVCIPLAKIVIDQIYPFFISNVATGMNLTFSWQLYLLIFTGVMILYLLINQLLVRKLKKILPAEILKNRE